MSVGPILCLYVVLSCVGRGLCDGLITRPEEDKAQIWAVVPYGKKIDLCNGELWCFLRYGLDFLDELRI
jgi:hypothetical protein